jgi:TRAP-type C4-dicarboxylate transport system permease large subunit
MVFSRMLVMEKVPQALSEVMLRISQNKYVVLFLINIFLFIVGMFVDDISGMIITAPLLYPIAKELGVSPVHFSAIIVTNLTMGNLTPPMAPLTFLAQLIGKTTFAEMLKPSLLFVFAGYIPVVFITTYWAPIAEWLPVAVLGEKVLIPAY